METSTTNAPDYAKQTTTSKKTGTRGRRCPKLVRSHQSTESPWGSTAEDQTQDNSGPLTITATNMTEEAVDRANEDAKRANTELHIRDNNGKVFQNNFENPF